MLSFATPLWLFGLLLVPFIRWLHRQGPHLRGIPVSSLALWRRAAASSRAAGERRPPDPAWRRRALLAALLFVALAGPQLFERRDRLTIWIDDSLSMLTRETGGTRLAQGMAQVRAALGAASPGEVEVRTLAHPWRNLGALTDATAEAIMAGAGEREPGAPPAALLRHDRQHWLLTDGADAAVLEWPVGTRPHRTFLVAGVTRNVGLEKLSARRSISNPATYDVLLKVSNGGNAREERSVVVATEAGELARSSRSVEPGTYALVRVNVPAAMQVKAMLEPGDALAADDEIVLGLRKLEPRRVSVDRTCPSAFLAAVRAHPALIVAQDSQVEAALDCGNRSAVSPVPTIRIIEDRLPMRLTGTLQWSGAVPESRRMHLDSEFLRLGGGLKLEPGDTVLLRSRDDPLIVARGGSPAVLETGIDFRSGGSARRPEIPLLVNFLFDTLLGATLLDEIAIVDRGSKALMVTSTAGSIADADAPRVSESRADEFARAFLGLALLVLLWELVALARDGRRLREPAKEPPS